MQPANSREEATQSRPYQCDILLPISRIADGRCAAVDARLDPAVFPTPGAPSRPTAQPKPSRTRQIHARQATGRLWSRSTFPFGDVQRINGTYCTERQIRKPDEIALCLPLRAAPTMIAVVSKRWASRALCVPTLVHLGPSRSPALLAQMACCEILMAFPSPN
jgi:hypothetical protein